MKYMFLGVPKAGVAQAKPVFLHNYLHDMESLWWILIYYVVSLPSTCNFSTMSQAISFQDRIVVVMGPTGAGKSTFIECATRQDGRTVGHKLRSFTADIRTVRFNHPTDGYPVVFVDTPGFEATSRSDMETLSMIADWLVQTEFQPRSYSLLT